MAKVFIGSLTFPTKSAALDHFKALLRDNPIGFAPKEAYDLAWLYSKTALRELLGRGATVEIVRHPEGGKCFAAVLGAETVTFSYPTAITRPDYVPDLAQHCRKAIAKDLRAFLDAQPNPSPCGDCGAMLPRAAQTADHQFPLTFANLLKQWATEGNATANGFEAWHRERATLRVLCRTCQNKVGNR